MTARARATSCASPGALRPAGPAERRLGPPGTSDAAGSPNLSPDGAVPGTRCASSGARARNKRNGRTSRALAGRVLAAAASLLLGQSRSLAGQAPPCPALATLPDSSLAWQESPAVPGRSVLALRGARSLPGLFIERLKFTAGFRAPAHVHSEPLYVTVLCGTARLERGTRADSGEVRIYPAGAFFVIPPHTPHAEWFDQEAVVEVVGIGPVETRAVQERSPETVGYPLRRWPGERGSAGGRPRVFQALAPWAQGSSACDSRFSVQDGFAGPPGPELPRPCASW